MRYSFFNNPSKSLPCHHLFASILLPIILILFSNNVIGQTFQAKERTIEVLKKAPSFKEYLQANPDYRYPQKKGLVEKGGKYQRLKNKAVKPPNFSGEDPVKQQKYFPAVNNRNSQPLEIGFDGIPTSGFGPADPVIAVGPNHIVQMVNGAGSIGNGGSHVEIYDKNGTTLLDTFVLESLTGVDGLGDPIVLYDERADRWLLTEFNDNSVTNRFIIAVSLTNDPVTTGWNIYSFSVGDFPDYPKYAIWEDAYIITTNNFNSTSNQNTGNGVFAIDRTELLAGQSTSIVEWNIPNDNGFFQAATPVHPSTFSPIPAGSDAYVLRLVDDEWNESIDDDGVEFWKMDLNWADPMSSTLALDQTFEVAAFTSNFCNQTSCINIPQSGSNQNLDAISQVIMNHAIYRKFDDYESIVATHVVNDNAPQIHAAIRWYEFRNEGNGWEIYQESTYSPTAPIHRFHSAINNNEFGEIVLSYNVSGANIFPGIRFTGRKRCDALNTMTYPETIITNGQAAYGGSRLGDYGVVVVDPINPRQFWTTAMYVRAGFGAPAWSTRIAAFNITDGTSDIYVDASSANNGNGSATNPFKSFVTACEYACDGSTIILQNGTYFEPLPKLLADKLLEFRSQGGSAVIKE